MASASTAGRCLRLLSYNIQTGIDSKHYGHYLTHSWKHVLPYARRSENLDRIAQVMSEHDVVGLQEVDAGSLRSGFINQTEYLAQRAEFPFWYDQTNRKLGKLAQHSIGVVSRLRPTEIKEYRLPGRIPGRGALCMRFGSEQHGLAVFILHLALSRRARLGQLAYIADLINKQPNVVLMGDLNCGVDGPEMDFLCRATTLCSPPRGLNTFPSWRPCRNIDHILVTPALQVERLQVLDCAWSDHLPVSMQVRLPESIF